MGLFYYKNRVGKGTIPLHGPGGERQIDIKEVNLEQDGLPAALVALHDEVDHAVDGLARYHGERLVCRRGCSGCCRDDLTIFEIEAMRIRRFCKDVLARELPALSGACAFLDGRGECRIYEHRPYVCRTQGLPLRWIEEGDGEWLEYRDICPLNEEGMPLETLAEEHCWTLGEVEGRLADLQARLGPGHRVSLRSLFAASESWEV